MIQSPFKEPTTSQHLYRQWSFNVSFGKSKPFPNHRTALVSDIIILVFLICSLAIMLKGLPLLRMSFLHIFIWLYAQHSSLSSNFLFPERPPPTTQSKATTKAASYSSYHLFPSDTILLRPFSGILCLWEQRPCRGYSLLSEQCLTFESS